MGLASTASSSSISGSESWIGLVSVDDGDEECEGAAILLGLTFGSNSGLPTTSIGCEEVVVAGRSRGRGDRLGVRMVLRVDGGVHMAAVDGLLAAEDPPATGLADGDIASSVVGIRLDGAPVLGDATGFGTAGACATGMRASPPR